jgi:hypothetical protein
MRKIFAATDLIIHSRDNQTHSRYTSSVAAACGKTKAMQNWLARLSFSFLIIAAVLAWETYKIISTAAPGQTWRIVLYAILAGVCAALAAAGMRARHRD